MGISYKKLWVLLIDRDIKKSSFLESLTFHLELGQTEQGEKCPLFCCVLGYLNCDIEIYVRLCGTDKN